MTTANGKITSFNTLISRLLATLRFSDEQELKKNEAILRRKIENQEKILSKLLEQ